MRMNTAFDAQDSCMRVSRFVVAKYTLLYVHE